MSKGIFKSDGAHVPDLASIAQRTPINRQASRGRKGKYRGDDFCPTTISVEQMNCHFRNLFGAAARAGARRTGKR